MGSYVKDSIVGLICEGSYYAGAGGILAGAVEESLGTARDEEIGMKTRAGWPEFSFRFPGHVLRLIAAYGIYTRTSYLGFRVSGRLLG